MRCIKMSRRPFMTEEKKAGTRLIMVNRERLSLFGVVVLLLALLINSATHGADFEVFYRAGLRWLSGEPIYQFSDSWMPYKYHPAWAPLLSIFTAVPFKFAAFFFTLVQVYFWWLAVKIWARWLKIEIVSPTRIFLLLALSLSAFSAETGYGQINGLLFLGATFLVQVLESENQRPYLAGLIAAALVSLKLNFGLLMIYALIKNWRTLIGFTGGVLVLHLVVALSSKNLLAVNAYQSWLNLLLQQSADQFYIFEAQGFLRFFHSIFGDFGKIIWALSLAGFIVGGATLNRGRLLPQAVASYWIVGCYLFSPLAWWYQILFMYPLLFQLLQLKISTLERRLIYLCLGVYALVTFNTVGHDGIILFKEWQGFFVCSLIIFTLYIVHINQLRRPSVSQG